MGLPDFPTYFFSSTAKNRHTGWPVGKDVCLSVSANRVWLIDRMAAGGRPVGSRFSRSGDSRQKAA